jgi:hypothetical protein
VGWFEHRFDERLCFGGDGDVDRSWVAYPGDQAEGLQSLELVLEGGCLFA